MSQESAGGRAARDRTARLGRALFYVQQQDQLIYQPVVRASLEKILLAGKAMDFSARLRDHGNNLTPALAISYAQHAGIGSLELIGLVLPALKTAGVVDYALEEGALRRIEEYVGLSGSIITQALNVLRALEPSSQELAALHSVEVACWAPLTLDQHQEQLSTRGFEDADIEEGVRLTIAAGVNHQVHSPSLNENVVYNPNVWASPTVGVDVAGYLRSLPPAERDSLLGIAERASERPGLALPGYAGFDQSLLNGAKRVGLVQAATVQSSVAGANPQTYIFSPVLERIDDTFVTTESLHHRKLFVAHILYGHEKAQLERGRINDPAVLVNRLIERGYVGPASNIASDYHLLEAAGIVSVRPQPGGRAYLHAVKGEIIQGGFDWLKQLSGAEITGAPSDLGGLRPPNVFSSPEQERAKISADGAATEITNAAILHLRETVAEAQRAARFDF